MKFHRIVIQLPVSKSNAEAINKLWSVLPETLGPIHGPHEILKLEDVEIKEFACVEIPDATTNRK
jgi:hypothetical protein